MMDQRELEARIKSLTKAVNDKEPAANVIAIMETLKNDVVATEELLRATRAGMIVNKLKGNQDKNIANLAKEIVDKWKVTVQARRKTAVHTSSPITAQTPTTPAPATEGIKGFKGDKSKRKFGSDGVDVKRTGMPTRDGCIGLIYNGLAFNSDETPLAVVLKAMEVEAAAYREFGGETAEYKSKLRSLFQNLKIVSNKDLGVRVMSGDITPERFIKMTHDELKSAERRQQDAVLEKENMMKAQVAVAEKAISDALRCGKCNQKKVSYTQAQTRSADEPMTTFCECTVCGNRWKFS
ncbi:transcription elongation factor s-ii [Calycina marina]|uniref:Transcription elongation factor n=1 Tax=Calycina marina TaxID=1763456 RepID=A0A9P7Z169_9HELO|nr:transcription elongation factor s-ii [Calycina marina]